VGVSVVPWLSDGERAGRAPAMRNPKLGNGSTSIGRAESALNSLFDSISLQEQVAFTVAL